MESSRRRAARFMRPPGEGVAVAALSAGAFTVTFRLTLQIRRRERALMTRVMTNSTRPISIRALRYRSSAASVNSLAMTAAIVYCGAKSDAETWGLLPMTMVTAIVSPIARPNPRMTAPMIPVRP